MKSRLHVLLLLVAGAFLVACGDKSAPVSTTHGPSSEATTPLPNTGATLTAAPNPVPAGDAPGTTTVAWDAGAHREAAVYVLTDGAGEKLFASGPRGSSEAPWIEKGKKYEFRLYTAADKTTLLQRVTVTRVSK